MHLHLSSLQQKQWDVQPFPTLPQFGGMAWKCTRDHAFGGNLGVLCITSTHTAVKSRLLPVHGFVLALGCSGQG